MTAKQRELREGGKPLHLVLSLGRPQCRAGAANKGGPHRTKHVEMQHGLLLHPPTAQVGAGRAAPPYLGRSRADPPAPRRHADGRTTAPPSGPRGRSCPSPRSCRRAGRPARLRPVTGSYNSGSYPTDAGASATASSAPRGASGTAALRDEPAHGTASGPARRCHVTTAANGARSFRVRRRREMAAVATRRAVRWAAPAREADVRENRRLKPQLFSLPTRPSAHSPRADAPRTHRKPSSRAPVTDSGALLLTA